MFFQALAKPELEKIILNFAKNPFFEKSFILKITIKKLFQQLLMQKNEFFG